MSLVNYYVKPFDVTPLNSLNNNLGNGGFFKEGQTTPTGMVLHLKI